MSSDEIEQRERDLDVVEMQLGEARDAIEDGDYLAAIEAAASVLNFAVRAAERDDPVASVTVDRGGAHGPEHIAVSPGEKTELEIHGKATITVRGEKRYTPQEGAE